MSTRRYSVTNAGKPWPKVKLTPTGLAADFDMNEMLTLDPTPGNDASVWHAIQVAFRILRPHVRMDEWTSEIECAFEGLPHFALRVPPQDVPLVHALASLVNHQEAV
jgi:hypothetical protein